MKSCQAQFMWKQQGCFVSGVLDSFRAIKESRRIFIEKKSQSRTKFSKEVCIQAIIIMRYKSVKYFN